MMKNGRALRFLASFLIGALVSAGSLADVNQTLTMTLEKKADLTISTGNVDLGIIQGNVGAQYYEKLNAVRVSFRCNAKTNWEVRLSGTNFSSGTNQIPITQLRWRRSTSTYVSMPDAGDYAVIATNADYPGHGANWHDEDISYRLNVTGDEYEGTYRAMLTYTLFVP